MADERITIRLECDVTPAERMIGKVLSHPLMVEAAARIEEKRREQNRRAVAWWRSQRPESAYRNVGVLAGRRNGKSWARLSGEGVSSAGAPNQAGGGR